MNEQQIRREWDGFWWLDQVDAAVERRAYNCTCQAGGVDAMSIDTDWLRHAARRIRREYRAMAERAQIAEARIQAVRAERDHARAQVDRVQEIHEPLPEHHIVACSCGWWSHDDCPHVRALDGEQ